MHDVSCFLTLTYNDEWIPDTWSVDKRVMQLFMKRVRKRFGEGIRFIGCGEYGDQDKRPHYHLVLFGCDFAEDRVPHRMRGTFMTYRSATLEQIWPFGFSEIGTVTPSSGQYVAKYVVKRVTGDRAADHYTRINAQTGEVYQVRPEFLLMSRNPGLGSTWFDKFQRDIYPSDFVTLEGQKRPVPAYYTKKLNEAEKALISSKRVIAGKKAQLAQPEERETRRLLTKHESGILREKARERDKEL